MILIYLTNNFSPMNKNLIQLFILTCIVLFNACNSSTPQKDNTMEVKVVPLPASMQKTETPFTFDAETKILLNTEGEKEQKVAAFIQSYINEMFQLNLTVEQAGAAATNSVFLNVENKDIATEGYTLKSDAEYVEISASTSKGVFYGIQTLIQLLPTESGTRNEITIAGVDIKDEPRYKWRGMHLDVCRHFMPVEFVKKAIDLLALHKMNTFHWHLTEDQGWRIEIKKYPKLTEIGAYRSETVKNHMANHPMEFDGVKHGGYYTQEEVKEVVAYAADRFVTIVPEIEMPGHAQAALAAYPEYSCTGGPFEVWTQWGISDEVYCAGKEETFRFIEDILSEVVDLFPGKYFHIGGDECPKVRWEECPDCQKRIKEEGLQDEHELQSYFVKRIEQFLNSKGKKLIGWDEILEGGLPERAAVMSWRGERGGIEAANSGHDVVMTPGNWCYFDHYQSNMMEPLAIAGLTNLKEVYGYEPMPKEIKDSKRQHILGAQANLWTEYILSPQHAEYMLYPRLSALAEVVWTPKEKHNFEDFKNRMSNMYNILDNKNVNYRIDYPKGYNTVNRINAKKTTVELCTDIPTAEIRYTIDGSEPDANATLYTAPIELDLGEKVILKSKTFMPSGRSSKTMTGTFEYFEPLKALDIKGLENGLSYSYYELETDSAEKVGGEEVVKSGLVETVKIPDGIRSNFFGIIFDGYIKVDKTGTYKFYLYCDDGAVLYVGGHKVVDNDGFKYGKEMNGHIVLSEGMHPIRIKYFNAKYGAALKLSYSTDGIEKTEIPVDMLYTIK